MSVPWTPLRPGPGPRGNRRIDADAADCRYRTRIPPVHREVRAVREADPANQRPRASVPRAPGRSSRPRDGVPPARQDGPLRGDPKSGGRRIKGLPGRQTRGLPKGARLDCIDNTGAKIVEIIEVMKYRGVRNRISSAGIADLIVVAVKKGTPETRKQVMRAVVVRQRRPFRRPEGMMVQFEDNACVIVTPEGEVKGSDIKGPVAREAAERWPRVAATASMIV